MLRSILTVFALMLGLMAAPAMAKDYANGITVEEMLTEAKAFSTDVSIQTTNDGKDKYIKATVNGTTLIYSIWMFECENSRCKSIQFSLIFDGDVSKVPEWNKSYRFARAYVTNNKTVNLEYDIDLKGGINSAQIQQGYQRFYQIMLVAANLWT